MKNGFSLIELIVTLAIVAIVMMIGVPNFNSAIQNSRLTTTANELVTAFHLARSESVKRNQNVVVSAINDNWQDGYRVFVDLSKATATAKNTFDEGDFLIKESSQLALPVTSDNGAFVTYNSLGITGKIIKFSLCNNEIKKGRLIRLNAIGRPMVSEQSC